MQDGLATSKLSVRPSVCQTRGSWQNGKRSVQIFMPYDRLESNVDRAELFRLAMRFFDDSTAS